MTHGWSVCASPTTFSSASIAIWTGVLPIDDMALDRLLAKGVIFGACNVALTVQSKMLAGNVGLSADEAAKEWAANLRRRRRQYPIDGGGRRGEALAARGVLVVPDFIANAGGVICAAVEYRGGTESAA